MTLLIEVIVNSDVSWHTIGYGRPVGSANAEADESALRSFVAELRSRTLFEEVLDWVV